MKIKKIYILILGLIIAVGALTGSILAWLTDTGTTADKTFTVGDVTYTWTPGTLVDNPVVPGQNIIATLSPYQLTNSSTVDSEIRMRITITYDEGTAPSADHAVDATDLVIFTLGTGWVYDTDAYYYTKGTAVPATNTTPFNVLTGLVLDGAQVGNDFSGIVFTMSLVFEAKQADYVTWAELGTANIDFGTGLTP
jgi:hypothetical protein